VGGNEMLVSKKQNFIKLPAWQAARLQHRRTSAVYFSF